MAASALAGGMRAIPCRQRFDVTIRLKRMWGSLFVEWCKDKSLVLLRRLPWGTMAKFKAEISSSPIKVSDLQLIGYARSQAQDKYKIEGRFCSTVQVSSKQRRRRQGAGRKPKAQELRQLLF